jgi:low affinity Fe/Cu permease
MHAFRQLLTRLGTLAAHPTAFLIVAIYALCWLAFSPATLDWHGFTTLIVWTMTLLIQRAEHRDTQALHAKLDELLSADKRARTEVARIDEREPEEIEEVRDRERGPGEAQYRGGRITPSVVRGRRFAFAATRHHRWTATGSRGLPGVLGEVPRLPIQQISVGS